MHFKEKFRPQPTGPLVMAFLRCDAKAQVGIAQVSWHEGRHEVVDLRVLATPL